MRKRSEMVSGHRNKMSYATKAAGWKVTLEDDNAVKVLIGLA